jgi:hypothetical protein
VQELFSEQSRQGQFKQNKGLFEGSSLLVACRAGGRWCILARLASEFGENSGCLADQPAREDKRTEDFSVRSSLFVLEEGASVGLGWQASLGGSASHSARPTKDSENGIERRARGWWLSACGLQDW